MINDRLNGPMNNSGKFRNRKMVSAVAIGIFVLILIVVLVAKGCSSRKRAAKKTTVTTSGQTLPPPPAPVTTSDQTPAAPTAVETITPPAPAPAPQLVVQPPTPADNARRLIKEGQAYYNGDGRAKNYAKAQKCFLEAKKLGAKDADVWLKKCAKKLPKKAAPRKKKKR